VQFASLLGVNLRTLSQRRGAALAAVVGIAGVVTVFLAVLSIAQGILRTMEMSVGLDNAIVLRSGSDTEMMSGLTGDEARLISEAPGIVQGPNGPQASSELFVIINLPKRSTGTDANLSSQSRL